MKAVCPICPKQCALEEGQLGFCRARVNRGGVVVSENYGRVTSLALDPIEKKPLNHFYPGSAVLSFGTAGCNLACKFCQNWDISRSKNMDRLMDAASPQAIAQAAKRHGAQSVAYTYNDPVIFAEYAIDAALACRELGREPEPRLEGVERPGAEEPAREQVELGTRVAVGRAERAACADPGGEDDRDPARDRLERGEAEASTSGELPPPDGGVA